MRNILIATAITMLGCGPSTEEKLNSDLTAAVRDFDTTLESTGFDSVEDLCAARQVASTGEAYTTMGQQLNTVHTAFTRVVDSRRALFSYDPLKYYMSPDDLRLAEAEVCETAAHALNQ